MTDSKAPEVDLIPVGTPVQLSLWRRTLRGKVVEWPFIPGMYTGLHLVAVLWEGEVHPLAYSIFDLERVV